MAKYCPIKQTYALYPDCGECSEKLCEAFFCLVVGSRSFQDYRLLSEKLDYLLKEQPEVVIVSGGANGADSLAERYAKEKNIPCIVFPAKWEELGKAAGYIRNREMMTFVSKTRKHGCVAFWDGRSKGTKHNFGLAEEFGVPIQVVRFE